MSLGLWLHPANVADCGRAFLARVDRARNGHVRLAGDAAAIIEAGIDRTWNGRSFTASPGWFHTFWVRDMCFSSVALARLGGPARVHPLPRTRLRIPDPDLHQQRRQARGPGGGRAQTAKAGQGPGLFD